LGPGSGDGRTRRDHCGAVDAGVFCDPHHPWQRGTNEHQPAAAAVSAQEADLSVFTQDELNSVAAKLNHRPRRVLDWATPAETLLTAEPKPMPLQPA
jgi:IS30 family transposase